MPPLPAPLRTEAHPPFTLLPPQPAAGLVLDRFEGAEAVSEPFRFVLQLLGERADLDLGPILGKPMGIALRTAAGPPRHLHGHVTRIRHLGGGPGPARFEAVLEPWTAFLDQRVNCRLFQNQPLPDLLRDLLAGYGSLARYEFRCDPSDFPPIPLCVQYAESDFRFLSRLLEAHGLHYFFTFAQDGHTLVVADDSTLAPLLPGSPVLAFLPHPDAAREDAVDGWGVAHALVPTACAARSFDFMAPLDPREASEPTLVATAGLPAMEDYRYAGAYAYPDLTAGQKLVRRRMEAREAGAEVHAGTSTCRRLACGFGFELTGCHRPGATVHDRRYFLTRVEHEGRNAVLDASPAGYRNRFACVPKLVPWRPMRCTPAPRVQGPQTATVVGPPGEEVHCDAYGRIRIRFHWDRLGTGSCWVRVATPWAGARHGFMAVPRVGTEVVVAFLDGDPDRPLVTGQVYNDLHRPPWPLPGSRTQTGILTGAGRDGGAERANALRFEDRAGSEEVWLHAGRDLRLEAEHDDTTTVGHDRSERVCAAKTTWVGGGYRVEAGEVFDLTVGDARLTLAKDGTITLSGKQVILQAEGPLKLAGTDIETP